MIRKTFRCEVKGNYVINSTIEYRLFGILLYKKEYFYPPEGSHGEYFIR